MINTQKFVDSSKAGVESFEHLAGVVLSGIEQLAHLQLAATREAIADSFEHFQALVSVRDPQQFIALQTGRFQPMLEKSASYSRQVYDIVSGVGAEFSRVMEDKMAEAQQSFAAAMDEAVRNAPVGSETAVALFRNAMSASQEAIQSAQDAARQVARGAESNVATVAEKPVSATKAAAKKR